jgi:hydroxyethylthiazole kinase-like uncharacterized protein yjeF
VHSADVLSAYKSDDLRAAEGRILAHLPNDALMQRAAAGLTVACTEVLKGRRGRVYGGHVALLVGTGNNGGDALLAGVRLCQRGVKVAALLLGDRAYEPGLRALRAAGAAIIECSAGDAAARARPVLATADLVVDAIVGLAGVGSLDERAATIVGGIPNGVPVLAVDLPSGVDPDSGEASGSHVVADVTVTFGALKPCLLVPPAARAVGRVVFVDVGVGAELSSEPVVRRLTARGAGTRWPVPDRVDHKYTRGVLGVVAGSDMYPGAAVLACAGAVRAGVGIVRFIGPARVTGHVLAARPEVVPGDGRVQAWLLGSGVDSDADQDQAITRALDSGLPCVVDAGALEACVRRRAAGDRPASADRVLLTPHAGELARMLAVLGHDVPRDEVEARPMRHAVWLAREADSTVLLKGSTTLIADQNGDLFSQADGPSWLATAGSGDVLAGIAGALMAGGINAIEAGAMAALTHGRAGARASAGGPLAALSIADATPETVAELLRLAAARPA